MIQFNLSKYITEKYGQQSEENNIRRNNDLDMPYTKGVIDANSSQYYKGSIENFIGTSQIPVGIVGPIKVNGNFAKGDFKVPMATTEAALVASYNRGIKAITLSGGVRSICDNEVMCRAPAFIFESLDEAMTFKTWCIYQLPVFQDVASRVTRHGFLKSVDPIVDGNYVFLNLYFSSGDAAGQNMVTFCSEMICRHIASMAVVKPVKWYIEGNTSGDKKLTEMSRIKGRGKKVYAEAVIPSKIAKRVLKTSPEQFVEYSQLATTGAQQSGMQGVNAHIANGLAAIFIACGQDVACVAESATASSRAALTSTGDLRVNLTLPNLTVGTVGGGTKLPTQSECLKLMDCIGPAKVRKFSEIIAGVLMAGEISIAAAISAGHFTKAHWKLARQRGK